MAFPRSTPLRFSASTLSDAVDSTNAPAGAMGLLSNLIPDPATAEVWVPRPACLPEIDFIAGGFLTPGYVSGYVVVGDMVYGTVLTSRFANNSRGVALDEPFAFNMATGKFVTVSGVTSTNTPASPPATGDWTPPILAQIGGRVIVTHPGFPGGATKFGWFDVSGSSAVVSANSLIGDPVLRGNPNVFPVQVGNAIIETTGGVLAGGVVVKATNPTPVGVAFTGNTHSTTTIDGIPDVTNLSPGLLLSGPGIQPGTTILTRGPGVIGPGQITLSLPATATANGVALFEYGPLVALCTLTAGSATIVIVTGYPHLFFQPGQIVSGVGINPNTVVETHPDAGQSIFLSQPATLSGTFNLLFSGSTLLLSGNASATADNASFTITGGKVTAPAWDAGDCDLSALPSVPVGVAQMNGRAFFACGTDGVPWSDSGFPCRRSNTLGVQALTTGDGLAVTAIGPLQLSSLLGGIVQALIAFEGPSKMQQITGDQTTGNLAMNSLSVATGTLSPLSICSTEKGLAFVSPEGMRIIDFSANVSPPIGDAGAGVTFPFINAAFPSRVCAASNVDTIRISVENGATLPSRFEEYWFDITRGIWSGPHTCAASMIQPWRHTFLLTFANVTDEVIYRSDAAPLLGSAYVERGAQLSWAWRTGLLPDSGTNSMIEAKEMTLACELAPDTSATVVAVDEKGNLLDQTTVVGDSSATIWGVFIWDQAIWGRITGTFRQRAVNWHMPIVFRQGSFIVTGQSALNVRVGNFYMRYQILGYRLENP